MSLEPRVMVAKIEDKLTPGHETTNSNNLLILSYKL